MKIRHLPRDASPAQVAEALQLDGCVVVDRLASAARLDQLRAELAPYIEANEQGPDEFSGRHTRRTGGLIARSETARDFVQDPLVLGAVGELLAHARNFQIHLTQVISMGPGETAQAVHRDQWAFDFFPFPNGYEVQCNTLWAMTDFTEANGATRVIPGSHRFEDRLELGVEATIPAEMERGSVLFYTGSLYHGGGANQTDAAREGLNLTYAVAWLRQEENQYLSVPHDVARTLPEPLLHLMGYARGAYALGYIDDLRDPIEAVRPELSQSKRGLGELEETTARVRAEENQKS